MARRYRTVNCVCCGRPGTHKGRGLRASCHQWHSVHGTLEKFPRTVQPAERIWVPTSPSGRHMLERYAQLDALRPRPSNEAIAFELGVTVRQVQRYAAALTALQQQASQELHSA